MKSNKILRYSAAFQSQVLSEIEAGELTIAQARRRYGINGAQTISNWARKSGRFGIVPKVIKVESPKEQDQAKALKEENRRLKETIADLVLDRKIAESTLEVICEQQGWDIEEIKKKAGSLLQQKSQRKGKK
jgi:transposase